MNKYSGYGDGYGHGTGKGNNIITGPIGFGYVESGTGLGCGYGSCDGDGNSASHWY